MKPWRTKRSRDRRGMLLVETVLSLLALAVVVLSITQAMVMLDRARKATARFDLVSRELENVLTEFTSQRYDEITADSAAGLAVPTAVAEVFPRATLETMVVDESNPAAKRVTAKLTPGSDDRVQPICLTTWVYDATEAPIANDNEASSAPPAGEGEDSP
ncbi:type II secretion system protein [Aeoliella mucimassa]|uniref:Uncharacterized protein n=1 Tax=Aeoliella mucimassa TaxID=2527972 RepID=A0A518AH71_9BACT|nr:hypothetical protein [Aeoliella mucimassa]QDU54062.1 hypothetical protein Pan181_02420 [Aeoliella mucimassa]